MRRSILLSFYLSAVPAFWPRSASTATKKVTPGIVSDWQLSQHSQNSDQLRRLPRRRASPAPSDVEERQDPHTRHLPAAAIRTQVKQFSAGQARLCLGRDEGHAHLSLAGDGHDRGHEGLRRLPQDRPEDRGGNEAQLKAGRLRLRPGLLRRLPHPPHVLEGRGPAAPGLPDLPHGLRPSRSGRCTPPPSTASGLLLKQNGTLDPIPCVGPHLSDLPHAGGQPRGAHRLGFPGRPRLPMPEDKQWAADRVTDPQRLSACSTPTASPTARLDVVKQAQVARLTQEDWQKPSATRCSKPATAATR